jgi:hypothetical protein
MVRSEGTHRAGTGQDSGKRRGKGAAAIIAVLAVLAVAAVLFFWLFDVDASLRGDIDAPDVDVQGGDVDLPQVDVDPENEADGTNPGGDTPQGG